MRRESEYAIEVNDVTVRYRSYSQQPTSLKEAVVKFMRTGRLRYYSDFNALSKLSFKVKKGCFLGIIGSNGAGKSTLLRVLSGVLPPSEGLVATHGSVDSLIQLGAGFDTELTARENIFLYESLRGKSRREISERVERILDFAELRDFSSTPLKYFSSGMAARLGFSCAMDIDPDILLIDEILAVGDERFAVKCKKVFTGFLNAGKTVVLVSHSVDQLAAECHQILVLSRGEVAFLGDPKEAVKVYRDAHYGTRLGSVGAGGKVASV
jgi:ABC-type polysaccharide/polyol phosphate transport system ATPase subunit